MRLIDQRHTRPARSDLRLHIAEGGRDQNSIFGTEARTSGNVEVV